MGQILGFIRAPAANRHGNEETSQVQFPPRSGCYFGSYFILGGEHFNTGRNDAYLFGDTNDLTFLSRRPAAFPYPAPAASEPSKTLQSLINIRRDSVKLIKVENSEKEYNIHFIIDADSSCDIVIYTLSREDVSNGTAIFSDPQSVSQAWSYPVGIGQDFEQPLFKLTPADFSNSMFKWTPGNEPVPLIIHATVSGNSSHSHSVFCMFEKTSDDQFTLKVIKQRQIIDGISFILQEIYGMESKGSSDRSEGNGECVVCLSAPRDTMILPCRHLCLCYSCAEDMRFRSNCCLICRQPFRALLRIEALQRVVDDADEKSVSEYERVDLVNFQADGATISIDSGSDTRSIDLPGISQTDIPLSVRTLGQSSGDTLGTLEHGNTGDGQGTDNTNIAVDERVELTRDPAREPTEPREPAEPREPTEPREPAEPGEYRDVESLEDATERDLFLRR